MTIQPKSIPMLDLQAQYEPIKNEVLNALTNVFESKQFILGSEGRRLEASLAEYCGCTHGVGVSSGTDALIIALMALDIKPGDEIITSSMTFFATAGSIARTGAVPVFVDIDPDTYNIDPKKIEEKITDKTKVIMPVHLYGQMADMESIMAIAKKHNLHVVEDAAQAIGASVTWSDGSVKKAGSIGDIGCFSFFPGKNLGCCGDGGGVVTNDKSLYETLIHLRNHGANPRYYHQIIGGNFRLDELQAAVLNVKLPHLEDQHKGRQKNAAFYNSKLEGSKFKTPVVVSGNRMIFNQYTLRCNDRDAILEKLKEKNIAHAVYYPVPLHLQDCFKELGYKVGDLPETEKAANEVFSIPIFTELSDNDKSWIVEVLLS
ncbi:DegT/DnrJ/EryC1/StrS family aminotransferase [bacterium]|jgi:dTDP-4-amino-4,6-dideoxygalactose transaminase|nr:DegT/DnrJ/EryC1/StrS family aminotransferase [bacterium]